MTQAADDLHGLCKNAAAGCISTAAEFATIGGLETRVVETNAAILFDHVSSGGYDFRSVSHFFSSFIYLVSLY